jgi:transcriptional regulator with XRE-family HTH domain
MLSAWRQSRGWSKSTLAQRAGVASSTLSRWESGKRTPSLPELEAVLDALEVSPEQRSRALQQMDAPRAVLRLRRESDLTPPVSGDLLRAMRLRRGLTQAELAQQIGVSQGRLGKWERSEDWPSTERLHALCYALKARPGEVEALTCGRFWLRGEPEEYDAAIYLKRAETITSVLPEALWDLAFLSQEAQLWQKVEQPEFAYPLLQHTLTYHAHSLKMYECNALANFYGRQALALARRGYAGTLISKTRAFQVVASTTGNRSRTDSGQAARLLAEALIDLKDPAYRAWLMADLAIRLAELGSAEQAFAYSREAVHIAQREGDAVEVLMRLRDQSVVEGLIGRSATAHALLSETRGLAKYGSDPQIRHSLLETIFLYLSGHQRTALEIIEAARQRVVNDSRLHYLRPLIGSIQRRLHLAEEA